MDQSNEREPLSRSEFWMRVAGASFGLWALMIPLGIAMLSSTFERAAKANVEAASEIIAFNRRFEAYVLNMERRFTIVEERQAYVLKRLSDMDDDIHFSKPKNGK